MAEGELSTKITILPSKIEAAAVSGRSEYLYFGKGLNQLRLYRHSAKLSWFMLSASISISCILFLRFSKNALSALSSI